MTRSSTKELISPLENPKRVLRSRRKLFDNPSLVELNPSEEDQLFEIEEHIEEEVTEIMVETMEQYRAKPERIMGSGVLGPQSYQDTPFELKGQFLKEFVTTHFSARKQEDGNEHIEKVLDWDQLYKGCPHKEEGKTHEEAYYTQFGSPYQPGGQYRAAGPGFYQRNNRNSSYPARRETMVEMRPYGSTMLSTRAGKFSISSESK
ncbi:hypothetical protein Tco_0301054 [Tanacetum coccineum]